VRTCGCSTRFVDLCSSRTCSAPPNNQELDEGEGVNGVWIPGVPELVVGHVKQLTDFAGVKAVNIPGYWLHRDGEDVSLAITARPGEKVLLFFHGGGYVSLSARPSDPTASIPKGLLDRVQSIGRVLSVEYRLSSAAPHPIANPFPAALIDALAGYRYLVDVVKFSPENIIVCGDSAGGNLAHALTLYLVRNQGEAEGKIPAPPGALILLSPWTDLSDYHDFLEGGAATTNLKSDFIDSRSDVYAKTAYTGPHGREIAEVNPYISPASLRPDFAISFHGYPRTFITAGGAEVLLDQIRTFKERLVKDVGEELVQYHEAADAIHDWLGFQWHEPERSDAYNAIAEWIEASTSAEGV